MRVRLNRGLPCEQPCEQPCPAGSVGALVSYRSLSNFRKYAPESTSKFPAVGVGVRVGQDQPGEPASQALQQAAQVEEGSAVFFADFTVRDTTARGSWMIISVKKQEKRRELRHMSAMSPVWTKVLRLSLGEFWDLDCQREVHVLRLKNAARSHVLPASKPCCKARSATISNSQRIRYISVSAFEFSESAFYIFSLGQSC